VRTAFSTIVYETHDYTCVLLDAAGDSIAQSTRSAPSFIGTLPATTKHLLRWFPPETLRPGDVLLTNDPWLGTGHTPDVNLVTPIFRRDRLVGFAGGVSHVVDIGGLPYSASARDVYEEGLRLPPCKLYEEGKRTRFLFDLLEYNTRAPEQVIGDIEALVTANAMGAGRLIELMDEAGIDDLGALGAAVQSASERAMRGAIARLPGGEYGHELWMDGFEEPLRIRARVVVVGDEIRIDYEGSSPQVPRGINSVLAYTYAYTAFGVKSLLDPETPNNQGAFRPIHVTAPRGSFLNPLPPAPVTARHLTGHMLPFAVYGALAAVVPDRVAAVSGSAPSWTLAIHGRHPDDRPFSLVLFLSGGVGATAARDGQACMSFPGLVANVPVELSEHLAPLRVHVKRLRPDSGGLGRRRGGRGQEVVIESVSKAPMRVSIQAERIRTPAEGVLGGGPGAPGEVLVNGEPAADPKGMVTLHDGDRITLRLPGGGGFGDSRDSGAGPPRRDS
jgi:N-methylhydantoinase B